MLRGLVYDGNNMKFDLLFDSIKRIENSGIRRQQ